MLASDKRGPTLPVPKVCPSQRLKTSVCGRLVKHLMDNGGRLMTRMAPTRHASLLIHSTGFRHPLSVEDNERLEKIERRQQKKSSETQFFPPFPCPKEFLVNRGERKRIGAIINREIGWWTSTHWASIRLGTGVSSLFLVDSTNLTLQLCTHVYSVPLPRRREAKVLLRPHKTAISFRLDPDVFRLCADDIAVIPPGRFRIEFPMKVF